VKRRRRVSRNGKRKRRDKAEESKV